MRKWLIYGVVAALVLIAVAMIAGVLLPPAHHAERTLRLARSPQQVFDVIADFARYPEWRSGVRRVTVEGSGAGALVREESSTDTIPLRVELFEPPTRLRTRIADPELPFGGTWTYTLRPAADGTEITIAEDGEIYNPMFRVMARYVFGYHATIDQYLQDLERRLR